jgi:uncharacterized protein (TIGR02596 family)
MKRFNNSELKGFSMVEMLVVLTVVAMLMAFAAPNVISLVSARTLSGEGSVIRNQLTMAQQLAVSKNADVEVRFFKWADESSAQTQEEFSAFQLFQYNNKGEMIPISAFFRVRAPATLSEDYSTLLQPGYGSNDKDKKYGFQSPQEGTYAAPRGFGGGTVDTKYVSFRFRPDGSTDLPNKSGQQSKDTWYLTLVEGVGAATSGSLPQNYLCLQINPYNGVVNEFRP